jgi:hypothetical protein
MNANRFEEEARARKVATIVLTAVARKITPAEIADHSVRSMLIANTPGVESASDETWRLVLLRLQDLAKMAEVAAATDIDALDAFMRSLS